MGVSDTKRWSATRNRIREPRHVTLEKARRKATALREQFLEGRDPLAEKRQPAQLAKVAAARATTFEQPRRTIFKPANRLGAAPGAWPRGSTQSANSSTPSSGSCRLKLSIRRSCSACFNRFGAPSPRLQIGCPAGSKRSSTARVCSDCAKARTRLGGESISINCCRLVRRSPRSIICRRCLSRSHFAT